MINRKIALTAAVLIGTATVALAETPASAKRHPMRAGVMDQRVVGNRLRAVASWIRNFKLIIPV